MKFLFVVPLLLSLCSCASLPALGPVARASRNAEADLAVRVGMAEGLRGEQSGERVRVVDLPHAGHFLLLEQPEAVGRAVSEFLGRQRSGLMTRTDTMENLR